MLKTIFSASAATFSPGVEAPDLAVRGVYFLAYPLAASRCLGTKLRGISSGTFCFREGRGAEEPSVEDREPETGLGDRPWLLSPDPAGSLSRGGFGGEFGPGDRAGLGGAGLAAAATAEAVLNLVRGPGLSTAAAQQVVRGIAR